MSREHRSDFKSAALAALACALALTGDLVHAASFVRPVDIVDWTPETDGNRLEPALLANLPVAICDDHFPAGSLARTQIEEGLALFAGANGVNISLTYLNATQYVPHKRKSTLFSSPPSTTLQVDYVDNGVGAVDPFTGVADNGIFPCHPTVGDNTCSSWSGNTCRYSSVSGWNAGPTGLKQAAVISINPYCFAQSDAANRLTTNINNVFDLDGVSHEMGHVVGLRHSGLRPFASDVFQTKMIQALSQLSAYDLGFLTHYYPSPFAIGNPDYSASRVLRLEQADGSIEDGVADFADYNPSNLYASSGSYYSCNNAERPVFTAQFFDKSPTQSEADVDVRFAIQPGLVPSWLEMHRETVPLSSSASKYNQIGVTTPPLVISTAGLGLAVAPASYLDATLQFETDPNHLRTEIVTSNNNVSMPMKLYRERASCPDRPRRLTASIRSSGDNVGESVAAADTRVVSGSKNHGYDAGGANYLSRAGAAWVHNTNVSTGALTFETKLVPTGLNARMVNDYFGSAVAMTPNVVAVGAPSQDYDSAGTNLRSGAGAVYVFRRSGATWTQEAKLTTTQRQSFDAFGTAVALSGDGNTLVVGAPFHDYDVNNANFADAAGAVFVYRYVNSQWQFSQKLDGTTVLANGRVAGDKFGSSVAIAQTRLAVGAPGHDYDPIGLNRVEDAGAAYAFIDSGAGFAVAAKLVASGVNARMAYDYLGASVAMYGHSDGRFTLLAGAWGQDYDAGGGNYASMAGAAYVYKSFTVGSAWVLNQKLTGQGGTTHRQTNDYFGKAVGLFGTRLIVGASGQDYNTAGTGYLSAAGAIYLFEPASGTTWRLLNKTGGAGAGVNARQANDAFGFSVAITSKLFATGATSHSYDDTGTSFLAGSGATFVYFR